MKDEGGKKIRDLRSRTKDFALRIIRLYQALPKDEDVAHVLGRQLLRSGTSVAAHYREACRAKLSADFIPKLEGALQELDETVRWLELFGDAGTIKSTRVQPLRFEADELIAIFVTMTRKIKGRR
ncbi:MAG TPA: four helix bundle protein [Chthoniobacterales bacterium]